MPSPRRSPTKGAKKLNRWGIACEFWPWRSRRDLSSSRYRSSSPWRLRLRSARRWLPAGTRRSSSAPLCSAGFRLLGFRDLAQTPPCGAAQLSDLRASALPARGHPPGDAAIFLRERDRRPAVLARPARASSTSAPRWQLDKRPFGTQLDVYASGLRVAAPFDRAAGRRDASRSASRSAGPIARSPIRPRVFNISAMSFGALSANAIRALNSGAKLGGFAHDTGEGGFSPYHREGGGDVIWEIGSGYFGCRTAGRRLRPGQIRRRRRQRPDQDDRDQAQPGRQARPRRRAAGAPR